MACSGSSTVSIPRSGNDCLSPVIEQSETRRRAKRAPITYEFQPEKVLASQRIDAISYADVRVRIRRRFDFPLARVFALAILTFSLGHLQHARAEDLTAAEITRSTAHLSLIDAVHLALERDPSIQIQRSRFEAARGSTLIAESQFDGVLLATFDGNDEVNPTGENTSSERRSFSQGISWSRLLETGQTLEPSVSLTQEQGNPDTSTATVAFTFRQPLLRGRDQGVVTADRRAAEQELEAARLDWIHLISERIQLLVSTYWEARAAMLDLEIQRGTEDRSRELLETTRRLVEADVTPAADLIQLEADLVFREASRIDSERSFFARLQTLGSVIGLNPEEIASLGLPADEFPTVAADEIPGSDRAYLAEAWSHRTDLAAEMQRLSASQTRLQQAEDGVKSRLDLVLTPSYTGLVEDNGFGDAFNALSDNIPGLSAEFGLTYSLPIGRRAAMGALIRSQESVTQQSLLLETQRISIGASVPTSLDAVRKNARRSQKLEHAVGLFRQTLQNEEKKLRAGSSILIDVLNQRDRLTSAEQRLVSARLALAQALIDLRFDTGTLVRPDQDGVQEIRLDDLITLPLRGL